MIPNKEPGYSLKVKVRLKGLERRWKGFTTVAVGNVKETQHEQGQKWLNHVGAQLSFGSMNSLV